MKAVPIPGDDDYGQEVRNYLEELVGRIEDITPDVEALEQNIVAVTKLIGSLALHDNPAVARELDLVTRLSQRHLEIVTNMFSSLVELHETAFAAEPEPLPAGLPTPDPAEITEGGILLPPDVREKSPDTIRSLLGSRVYGLTQEELAQYSKYSKQASSVIRVDGAGKKLVVEAGNGIGRSIDTLSSTVVRCINIYSRVLISGATDFKKSDIEPFGPSERGFINLTEAIRNTDDTMDSLGVSRLFAHNGQRTTASRYVLKDTVLFMQGS